MSRLSLERIYEERGLNDYKIHTLDDLFYIYDVKMNQIDGYFNLNEEERSLFNNFVINYFNCHGLHNKNIAIIKVYKSEKGERVEFLDNGEWKLKQLQLKVKN